MLPVPQLASRLPGFPAQTVNRLRVWNTEAPVTPKFDAVDLFSGCGSIKAAAFFSVTARLTPFRQLPGGALVPLDESGEP